MQSITEYLSAEHRHCDDLFAEAEAVAAENDPAASKTKFDVFHQEMEKHLLKEENFLFAAIEEATGDYMSGPTRVMRMEHGQMRGLFEDIQAALDSGNILACAGLLETLLMVMQQHNLKEEQMLYQMADRMLGNGEDVIRQMKG